MDGKQEEKKQEELEDETTYIEPQTNLKNIWKKIFVRIPIFEEGFKKKEP